MADLIGTFNVDGRKNVSKLSSLKWFLLLEDLCNGDGPLQANKTSENIRI